MSEPPRTGRHLASVSERLIGPETTVVRLEGPFDLTNAAGLERSIDGAARGGQHHLILDLTGVTWLDSAAMAVIVFAARRMLARRGKVGLVPPPHDIWESFEILGLDALFVVAEGVEAVQQHPDFAG